MANMANAAPGKRKGATSPSNSTYPSPSTQPIQLPRLKLSFRNTPPPQPQPASRAPAKVYARNRAGPSTQRRNVLDDSDSDLTPEETDDDEDDDHDDDEDMDQDEEDEDEQQFTPRNSKSQKGKNAESATKGSSKAASKSAAGRKSSPIRKKTSSSAATAAGKKKGTGVATPASGKKTLGTEGPGGREKKKAVKVGDKARRRARDEKFGMGYADGFEATPSRIRSPMNLLDSDSDSSYGDDESDQDASLAPAMQQQPQSYVINGNGYGYETDHDHDADMTDDERLSGLPMAFAGQEIEDLAYGGGRPELDMESQVLSGLWEDDEDEDEELFISQLSGSEAELGSQSSVHESDSDESSSEESSTDDELDEFGFPRPSMAPPSVEDAPLVLMENWDGQFVLVQPRQEKAKRRRDSKGSRDSRTAGSVGGSTVLSQADQQALLIDADADDDSSSAWSGLSEEEDCGDTTDSMEEDDMPLLDSPALDVIIGEQMGGLSAFGSGDIKDAFDVGPPSIVVTDPTGTPTLAPPGLQTPGHPLAINGAINGHMHGPNGMPNGHMHGPNGMPNGHMNGNINGIPNGMMMPHPPAPSTPAALPTMGTFHPTTDDPACHAVIDGSNTPTKSPFTHGRRSRQNRANSVSTTKSSVAGSVAERKRKSSITPQLFPDPFFPPSTLPKRARYSSIPGHPRFVAAKRQAERERMALLEEEETTDEEIGMDLEDMLEGEMLAHDGHGHGHGHHGGHGFRFDRVPVSTYLRRNFGGGAGGPPGSGPRKREQDLMALSSPSAARGHASYGIGMGMGLDLHDPYAAGHGLGMGPIGDEGWGLGNTLAGPPARMMLVSPGLPAVREGVNGNGYAHDGASSRKERRRKKRAVPIDNAPEVPALQI